MINPEILREYDIRGIYEESLTLQDVKMIALSITKILIDNNSFDTNWDKLLRSQAEMENLKRRTTKDLENAHKFALEGFVKALLEVSDSLTMGLKSAQDEKATLENTTEGLELTMKVFNSTLEKFGVESINPIDEKFDPDLHEAVTMVPMPDKKPNTVLEVVQTGFTLNGRLVRPALVIVVQ